MTVYVSRDLCDQRHEETERQFIEIKAKLTSIEGKLDVMIDAKAKAESTQKELSEHKEDHWKFGAAIIAICGVIVTGFALLK